MALCLGPRDYKFGDIHGPNPRSILGVCRAPSFVLGGSARPPPPFPGGRPASRLLRLNAGLLISCSQQSGTAVDKKASRQYLKQMGPPSHHQRPTRTLPSYGQKPARSGLPRGGGASRDRRLPLPKKPTNQQNLPRPLASRRVDPGCQGHCLILIA